MSSLAKALPKSRIESQYERWSEEAWKAVANAFLSRMNSPPPRARLPNHISQDSLILSAEKLQQLADLPTPPKVMIKMTAPIQGEDLDALSNNHLPRRFTFNG